MDSLVSIVIPAYNGSNYLKEAIASALAQTYKNIEVIVVNDGSNDGGETEKIAKSYGSKIRYFKKENGGVASALNLGIEKMTGEYFSWLSHDDMYEKTKIEDQVNFLNKLDSKNIIVACNTKVLFESGIRKKEKIDANTFKFIDIFLSTSANVGVNGCSLLIPKDAFEICGRFNPSLSVTQDYDLWFRMKDKYKFMLLDQYLVISRRHDEQDSVKKQKYLFKTADKLHASFLSTISYNRFKKYFADNKKNTKHTYKNYIIYKSRGYSKTASMILRNILQYYHEMDKKSFYKVFASEVDPIDRSEHLPTGKSSKLTVRDRMAIDREYIAILNSGMSVLPLKESTIVHKTRQQQSKIQKFANRIGSSVKNDGMYLTVEKAIRKSYIFCSKIIK